MRLAQLRQADCDLQKQMTGFLRRYLTFARRRRPRKRSFTQRLSWATRMALFCGCLRRFAGLIRASCGWARNLGYFAIRQAVLYGRCQPSSRPHARSRKGESRRTLSEPFSRIETCIIHTCKEYSGAQLRSARCCSSCPAQQEDRK